MGFGGAPAGGEQSGAGVGWDPACPCPGSTAPNMKVMTLSSGVWECKGGNYNKRFYFVLVICFDQKVHDFTHTQLSRGSLV